MNTTDKLTELYLKYAQQNTLHQDYLVKKATRDEVEDDELDRATITTTNKDRHGDIVVTSGIDIDPFMTTRTVMYQHGRDVVFGSLPIGNATEVKRHRSSLEATWKWATEAQNPKAQLVKEQWRSNFINATSIGFLIREAEPIDDEENKNSWFPALKITKSELVEFSVVNVPSNRESLRKSFDATVVPLLEKLASNQAELVAMITEVKSLLSVNVPTIELSAVEQYRQNGVMPTLKHLSTIEEIDAFLTNAQFTLEEKFTILHENGSPVEELIEFYSQSKQITPVSIVVNDTNTQLKQLQELITTSFSVATTN